jgi:urease accessory protein
MTPEPPLFRGHPNPDHPDRRYWETKNVTAITNRAATALLALTFSPLALAHHPLAGGEMTTFAHGLFSGLGHPVLGFDHLLFVALVGIAAAFTRRPVQAPAGYIAAMVAGCALMAVGLALPGIEAMIALSLLALGGVLLAGRTLGLGSAVALFAVAGLFHGSAFGEAMAAAEAASAGAVLAGYLVGLGVVQYAIALGSGWVARRVWQVTDASAIQPRLAGAAVAGVGVFLTLQMLEGAVFSALGLA